MSCLQLAEKLAQKSKPIGGHALPISPSVKKLPPTSVRPMARRGLENSDSETNLLPTTVLKPLIRLQQSNHDYVPPFSRVFTDKNLHHYFERFAWEKHLIVILNFIDSVRKYKEKFPINSQKQKDRHQELMKQLGLLPSEYVNSVVGAHEEMKKVSVDSFNTCQKIIEDKLELLEYPAFIDSPHFAKWTLKYFNTEVQKC